MLFQFVHLCHFQHPLVVINSVLHPEALDLELDLQDGVINGSILENEVNTVRRLNFVQENTSWFMFVLNFLSLVLNKSLLHLEIVTVPSCRLNSYINYRLLLAIVTLEEVIEFLARRQVQLFFEVLFWIC